tara:strand:+ start:603 stop:800 length:198 start_codon:yes stop_codon:yes gene_type:complete
VAEEEADVEASEAFVVAVAALVAAAFLETKAAASDAAELSTLLWIALVWFGVTADPLKKLVLLAI